jgi:hypothetical protein
LIAPLIGANTADFIFRQVTADPAAANPLHGILQHCGQVKATVAVALQQVQCHSLGGLGADTGKAAQCLDQLPKK